MKEIDEDDISKSFKFSDESEVDKEEIKDKVIEHSISPTIKGQINRNANQKQEPGVKYQAYY